MDKTREYLALLQKHHFWVICGVVLLASFISWYMAESKLDREREAQKTLIEGKFTAVNAVASTADHPNEKTTTQMKGIKGVIEENVFIAWKLRFDEQLKVPQWQGDLSPEFLQFIRSAEARPTAFRVASWKSIRNFIEAEIETLFTQVNSRNLEPIEDPTNPASVAFVKRFKEAKGRGVAPNNNEIGINWEWKGLVAWDETERQKVREQYYWPNRRPTSQQVRYANEDLWIDRALLDIIVKTNMQPDGETQIKDHLVCNIKKIETLNIGQMVPLPLMFFVPPATIPGAAPAGDGGEEARGVFPVTGVIRMVCRRRRWLLAARGVAEKRAMAPPPRCRR